MIAAVKHERNGRKRAKIVPYRSGLARCGLSYNYIAKYTTEQQHKDRRPPEQRQIITLVSRRLCCLYCTYIHTYSVFEVEERQQFPHGCRLEGATRDGIMVQSSVLELVRIVWPFAVVAHSSRSWHSDEQRPFSQAGW